MHRRTVGQPIRRPDAPPKVTGRTLFPADLYMDGMLHVKVAWGDRPHARLLRVDTSGALAVSGVVAAFTFAEGFQIIGMGAWLGTIMLFNVWVLIWPNQKKILGLDGQSHEADVIARAKTVALMASRTNTLLSVPMLFAMTAQGHGMLF